jgi:hypothetical protein
MDLQEVECGGMDWIDLAQYRDRWRALLSEEMSSREISCLAENRLGFQE